MKTTKRQLLLGSASAALLASGFSQVVFAKLPLDPGGKESGRKTLVRMIRVMYPHKRFGDGPYERTADAIVATASKTPAQKIAFASALQDLDTGGFADLDDTAALAKLKTIETTEFFQLVRGTTITTLYDDAEVWSVLGYEGPSFDKGGYIKRGFNDLTWLPDPRIEEYGAGQ